MGYGYSYGCINGKVLEMRKKRFIKLSEEVVLDIETKLEWVVGHDDNGTWYDAKAWIDSLNYLNFAGGNWRFPKIYELDGLCFGVDNVPRVTPLLKIKGRFILSDEAVGHLFVKSFDLDYCKEECRSRSISCDSLRAVAVRVKKNEFW